MAAGSSTSTSTASTSSTSAAKSALSPSTYRALKTEQGVFTTPPYSADLKGLWRFKNAEVAQDSAEKLFERFESYRQDADFVGMDMARKFIQMGRTRSLRYALRKGGKKYERAEDADGKNHGEGEGDVAVKEEKAELETDMEQEKGKGKALQGDGKPAKKEIPRTGKVYDQTKLDGAQVFESFLDRCWADEVYKDAWESWKVAGKGGATVKSGKKRKEEAGAERVDSSEEKPMIEVDGQPAAKRQAKRSKR